MSILRLRAKYIREDELHEGDECDAILEIVPNSSDEFVVDFEIESKETGMNQSFYIDRYEELSALHAYIGSILKTTK